MESKQEMSKAGLVLTLIAIGFAGGVSSYINPIMQKLIELYPEVSVSSVRMLSTVISLMSIFVSLPITIFIGDRVKYRTAMIIAAVCTACGGLAFFFDKMPFGLLFATRVIMGVGSSLCILRNAMWSKIFAGEAAVLAAWMGYQNVVFNVLNISLPTVSGLLGDRNLRYPHALCFLALPSILVFLFFLKVPNDGKAEGTGEKKQGFQVTWKVIFYTLNILFVTLASFAIFTGVSTYVQARGFGEAAVAGTITSMYNVGCLAGSLTNGWYTKHMKSRFTIVAAMALMTLSFALIVIAPNVFISYMGAFICGVGFTYNMLTNVVWAGAAAPEGSKSFAITLTTIGVYFGSFLSTFWITFSNAVGSVFTFLSTDAERSYMVSMFAFAVFTVIALLYDSRPDSVKENA